MKGQLRLLEIVMMGIFLTVVVISGMGVIMREAVRVGRAIEESGRDYYSCPAALFSSPMDDFSGPALFSFRKYFRTGPSNGFEYLPMEFETLPMKVLFGKDVEIKGGAPSSGVVCMLLSPVTGRPMWVVER